MSIKKKRLKILKVIPLNTELKKAWSIMFNEIFRPHYWDYYSMRNILAQVYGVKEKYVYDIYFYLEIKREVLIITKYPSDYEGLNYIEFIRLILKSKKIVFRNTAYSPGAISLSRCNIDELLANIDKILNLLCNVDVNVTRKSRMREYEAAFVSILQTIIITMINK